MLKIRMNLRKVIAMVICLAGSMTMFAQDIIIRKNGAEIPAIVQEVGIDDIRYKKFDYQNGPIYRMRTSDISMIIYEDGSQDVFDDVSPSNEERQQTAVYQRNYQRNYYRNNYGYSQQKPPVLRYTFGKQINPYGSDKSPFLAGVLSFFIPGLGQFYNGDVGAGFLFLGCNVVCNSVWMSTLDNNRNVIDDKKNTYTIAFIGALAVNVCSVVNGVRVAKKVNRARGYYLGEDIRLKIQPAILQQHNFLTGKEYAYGMNFSLNF